MHTYHRSEHSPGVRFCKYLLAHRLTGRHVCFSCFAFTFCPLPISITLSNILLWTVCLPGLSDRFESKKDGPKTGYQVKEVHKAVNSTTLHMQNIILRKKEFYSVKLPFEHPPPPPPQKKNAWGHISTLDSTPLFVICYFKKVQSYATFGKLQTSVIV